MSPAVDALRRGEGCAPFVYGHRGTRRGAPENTLLAMRHALSQGADGIELDVRLCASGEVVVLHDPDLGRVAGTGLAAAAATLEQLRAHDLGQGERVPTLEDAMQLVLGAGLRLNVELKADVPDAAALVRAVASRIGGCASEVRARVVLSSFSAAICRDLVLALPDACVAFLFERDGQAAPAGVRAWHPQHALASSALVAHAHAQGLVVNVWTVNDAARARALAASGVDGIITDDVPLVRQALAAATG